MRDWHFIFAASFVIGVVFLAGCQSVDRTLPQWRGIPNFAHVSRTEIYRGGEPPDEARVIALKEKRDIRTILDLREPKEKTRFDEQAAAQQHGIQYVAIPLDGLFDPCCSQVAATLHFLSQSRSPVYVHCKHGCERTGTVIAAYRIQHDHWSVDRAMAEANERHMSPGALPMRQFIRWYARSQQ